MLASFQLAEVSPDSQVHSKIIERGLWMPSANTLSILIKPHRLLGIQGEHYIVNKFRVDWQFITLIYHRHNPAAQSPSTPEPTICAAEGGK